MIIVEFDDDGKAIEDYRVESFVLDKIKQHNDNNYDELDLEVSVSNGLVIETFRALVVEKKFDHNEIQFLFKGQYIQVNKHGALSDWPIGFSDYMDKVLNRILGWNNVV